MILESDSMDEFEEDLFFTIVKHSDKAPIDLIKALEGMKYQVYTSIDIFRNAKKYPPERMHGKEAEAKKRANNQLKV